MIDRDKPDPAPMVEEANALADAAVGQARAASKAADEFLNASKKFSLESSEVAAGAVAGSAALAAGIWAIGLTTASAFALPAIAVAGIGAGILGARGRRNLRLERERRNMAIQSDTALDPMRQLRGEIAAAHAAGAPKDVIDSMWQTYNAGIAAVVPAAQSQPQIASKKPQLALPPGRPGTPESGNSAQGAGNDSNDR